jgi:DNA-binding CsgD family transcriptional regulator
MMAAEDRSPFRPGTSSLGSHVPRDAPSQRAALERGHQRSPIHSMIADAALHVFVEQFEEGVAVVDRCGRVLFLNAAARIILGGVHLRLLDGCLRANAPSDGVALRKVFARCAIDGCECSMRFVSGDDTLLIAVSALPSVAFAYGEATLLLRLVNPATNRLPNRENLQAQFGFTPAEAAFALEMLAGNDLAEIAARRGITLNTARAHLRSVFDKTDTRRQAALIRLLLLCPQTIGRQAALIEANDLPTRCLDEDALRRGSRRA